MVSWFDDGRSSDEISHQVQQVYNFVDYINSFLITSAFFLCKKSFARNLNFSAPTSVVDVSLIAFAAALPLSAKCNMFWIEWLLRKTVRLAIFWSNNLQAIAFFFFVTSPRIVFDAIATTNFLNLCHFSFPGLRAVLFCLAPLRHKSLIPVSVVFGQRRFIFMVNCVCF